MNENRFDVFLNEKYIGYTKKPIELAERLKELRRKGVLPKELNVEVNEDRKIVNIYTSEGRVRRPLIVVKDGKPLLTREHIEKLKKGEIKWDDLVREGIIEYLDASEEENAYIALWPEEVKKEHTHLEISPLVIFGTEAILLPFINYNKADRALIAAKMVKQGLGYYFLNYPLRVDTDTHIMWYPQRPIVKTIGHEILEYDYHPTGVNVVVAVLTYKGYNMDDAIVINRGSIERGLFRSYFFRPYSSVELRYPGGLEDRFEIPNKDVRGYKGEDKYKYLDEDGLIFPSAEVDEGDVLIGKTSPPRFLVPLEELRKTVEYRRDSSITVRHEEYGVVDKVVLTENAEGRRFARVVVRTDEPLELGDKLADRSGQKGVVGFIVNEADMPFTASGIIPDILFSPFSLPTRMTVGYLLEALAGKVGALRGEYIDGTPWYGIKEEELRKWLIKLGFKDSGVETMYNPETGEEMEARIFVGVKFYMKLRHLAHKKLHARAKGPIQLLTRQPTEGKSKEGGLRFGEMEKDCLLGHGAAFTLYERFSSDRILLPVCKECGLIAIEDKIKKKLRCPIHGEKAEIVWVEMSYAFKLFLDELKAFGIYPRLIIKPKE